PRRFRVHPRGPLEDEAARPGGERVIRRDGERVPLAEALVVRIPRQKQREAARGRAGARQDRVRRGGALGAEREEGRQPAGGGWRDLEEAADLRRRQAQLAGAGERLGRGDPDLVDRLAVV